MIDNRQIRNINKLLKKQIVQRFGVVAIALVAVSSIAYFGVQQNQASHAASVGVLSMIPSTTTPVTGSNVTVALQVDSGTDTINSVQASVGYNAAQLQYVSMAEGTAFPTIAATSTGTSGIVRVGRATSTPVSGVNTIVTLTFKVIAASGAVNLTYDPAFSFIVRSTDNANTLTASTGTTLNIKLPAPTISALTPTSGTTAGGTRITVTGTNFVSGATVSVGGVAASSVTFNSSGSLSVTVGAHSAGAVAVVITNPDGQSVSLANGFTYSLPAPTFSSLTPTSGTTAGGTTVTINGSNFTSGAQVSFGGVAAATTTVVSSSQITAVTPAHTAGANTVSLTFPNTTAALAAGTFTFVIPAPTISAVTPAVGPIAGGTTITVTGASFAGITGVTVGGTAATGITVVNASTLTAVTPAHAAGIVTVTVTNTSGTATKASAFTYRSPAPTVSSVSPGSGMANGGTTITISGTGFASGATVTVGGTAASSVTFVNATTLTARTPAHAAGSGAVIVTNPDTQSGTLANAFLFLGLGDANNDGRVNAIDLSILISHDGQNYSPADFNGDGTVGSADLAILLGRWTW